MCFISSLSLVSFRRLEWHADERPRAEIVTLYQHTECVYLRNTNIQQMIRWMCGVSMKDRKTSEELRELVEVEPITTVIKSGRLRWYKHVMRKSDEDWMKKSVEYRVESGGPVGRTLDPQRRCP